MEPNQVDYERSHRRYSVINSLEDFVAAYGYKANWFGNADQFVGAIIVGLARKYGEVPEELSRRKNLIISHKIKEEQRVLVYGKILNYPFHIEEFERLCFKH